MSQAYNDNIKAKLQDTQLEMLKIHPFCQKIRKKDLGPGETVAGIT